MLSKQTISNEFFKTTLFLCVTLLLGPSDWCHSQTSCDTATFKFSLESSIREGTKGIFHSIRIKAVTVVQELSFSSSSPKFLDFPGSSDGKESACNAGNVGSIPGSGRSPGEGNSNPLQYSCLENSMDRGAWQATVHGVAESWT